MLGFSGIPTALGVFVFFAAYWVVSHQWLDLPNTAVLLVSMGCFGLGVLGLSYGILSASWDENQPGSFLGGEQVAINWSRITAAWRSAREESKGKSSPKPR
jgi:UDP-N-acetylmuramyl pentapeptide phosphotransferase/UDP-N-acetylglucosamine-1-phosphate transferase